MGIFKRVGDMTKASINELLDKVEDPVVMLNQYIRDMEEEIAKAEVTVAKQMANERKIHQRLEEAKRISTERESQAAQALKNGNEEAARKLLEEKIYYDQKTAEYTDLYEESKAQAEDLSQQLNEMKEEYYKMRNKRNELVSRVELAKAKKQMAKVSYTNTIEGGHAARGFHRMEEKIMQMEAEAEIARRPYSVSTTGTAATSDPVKAMKIEEQLQQLKEKVSEDTMISN